MGHHKTNPTVRKGLPIELRSSLASYQATVGRWRAANQIMGSHGLVREGLHDEEVWHEFVAGTYTRITAQAKARGRFMMQVVLKDVPRERAESRMPGAPPTGIFLVRKEMDPYGTEYFGQPILPIETDYKDRILSDPDNATEYAEEAIADRRRWNSEHTENLQGILRGTAANGERMLHQVVRAIGDPEFNPDFREVAVDLRSIVDLRITP